MVDTHEVGDSYAGFNLFVADFECDFVVPKAKKKIKCGKLKSKKKSE